MKEALLSIFYLIFLLIGIFVLNFILENALDYVILPSFSWFNARGWILKLIILFFGGYALFTMILGLLEFGVKVVGTYVFRWLPLNLATMILASMMLFVNIGFWGVELWKVITHWTFWTVIEYLFVMLFIFSLHSLFIPKKQEEA
ncbi:hypothetical protein BH09BAC3_BH09BAC3_35820 [soil metagenome]